MRSINSSSLTLELTLKPCPFFLCQIFLMELFEDFSQKVLF
jgi:hypothetical protein